jgi:hypothetical protein
MLDPDGAANADYEHITKTFQPWTSSPEAAAYGRFILKRQLIGRRISLIINVHNVQSKETQAQIFTPMLEMEQTVPGALAAFNDIVVAHATASGYKASFVLPQGETYGIHRFGGWVAASFGGFHAIYELDSQSASRHLNISECRGLGRVFADAADELLHARLGRRLTAENRLEQETLDQRWKVFEPKSLADSAPFDVTQSIGLDQPSLIAGAK